MGKNGFLRRFCEGIGRRTRKLVCWGQGRTRQAAAGCSDRLRRKSGLCYTADAKSPFEAYINVR